jgi:hypothetical protein
VDEDRPRLRLDLNIALPDELTRSDKVSIRAFDGSD